MDDEVGQLLQASGPAAEEPERGVRGRPLALSHAARFLDAVDRGKGDLVLGGVLAGGLAQRLGRFLDVEQIVHDLEGESYVLAITGKRVELRFRGARVDGADADAGPQQSAGLGAMDGLQENRVGALPFPFEVGDLACHHASRRPGRGSQLQHHASPPAQVHAVRGGEHLESHGEQGVAGQDRHGFPEDLVAGGTAAPQVVVVECGQIVVDQGVGVD